MPSKVKRVKSVLAWGVTLRGTILLGWLTHVSRDSLVQWRKCQGNDGQLYKIIRIRIVPVKGAKR